VVLSGGVSRLLGLLLLAAALPAEAQFLRGNAARLWVTGGGAVRDHQQFVVTATARTLEAQVYEVSPTDLHLSGAYFFHRFLGVNVEGRGEFFYGCCNDRLPVKRPSDGQGIVFQPAFDASAAFVARALPVDWLGLEAHVGVQTSMRSSVALELRPVAPTNPAAVDPGYRTTLLFGPMFGAAVVVAPVRFFQAMVFARLSPVVGSGAGQAWLFSTGAQLSLGALRVGPLQLGLGPTVEYVAGELRTGSDVDGKAFTQRDFRFGGGLTVQQWVDDAVAVVVPAGPQALAGRVVLQSGAAAVDARVTLDGARSTATDLNGRFTFEQVAEGPHRLEASKDGVTPTALEVTVPVAAEVSLTLGAPTGPGRLRGVVKQPSGPLAGATLTALGEPTVTVKSGADGSYVLEKVGPGPVTVRVKAEDFSDAEEVAQVAPGGEATLDFMMTPKAVAVQATLRGLIRAKSGEPVKATVRVVELKLRLQVKADGRFSAEVPSGKYTLIIEARGYVTQTKTVEVSGGDQAIFHTELERSR
jgi:hypothetical protein